MGTSLALIARVAVAGTISYLTDTDSDVNVMTLGNVDIEQLEYERIVDETSGTGWKAADTKYAATFGNDTYYPDAMQPFTQGKLVMPLVYTDGDIKWDDRNGSQAATGDESHQQSWKEVGAPGSNQLFDNSVKNVIDKFVFVKNTGRSDAYYRTVIAIECPDGTESLIHTNTNGNSRFDWEDIGYTTIAGVRYKLKVATYNEVLTPGEVSRPSLLQVFLGKEATNEDVAKFGDTMDILVVSQGVQTSGFDNAAQALDEAFGDITLTNHPWSDEAPVIPTVVSNAEELKAEIENAQAGDTVSVVIANNITITEPIVAASGVKLVVDGGNHTITADGMTNEIVLLTGGNADISNLTITGTAKYAIRSNGGTDTLTNVNINMDGNYVLCFYGGGTTVLNNCNVSGTPTSMANVWFGDGRNVTINGGSYGFIVVNASNGSGNPSAGTATVNNATIGTVYLGRASETVVATLVNNNSTIGNIITE